MNTAREETPSSQLLPVAKPNCRTAGTASGPETPDDGDGRKTARLMGTSFHQHLSLITRRKSTDKGLRCRSILAGPWSGWRASGVDLASQQI